MRSYIYTLIIVIVLGFTLISCTQQPEIASTKQNPEIEESKDRMKPIKADQNGVGNENGKAITVYKSPTCGCCNAWESHLTKAGFQVTSIPTDKMTEIREKYKVPENMQSCHTAVIDGYVIEGHVPASDVLRLLETRPDIAGLAAPGMPAKSPGMQPEGEKPANYDVFSFDREGNTKVFSSY